MAKTDAERARSVARKNETREQNARMGAALHAALGASSALAKHLLATSQPANDNAGPPPVRQIAQAHDVLADYLRARAA